MDVESALISKVIHEGTIGEALDLQIQNEYIVENTVLWEKLVSTYRQHGSSLPVEYVKDTFPGFVFHEGEVALSFLVEELRKRWLHGVVSEGIRVQAEKLKARDPFGAVEEMRKVVASSDVNKFSKDVNLTENTEERVKKYAEIVAADGMTGLPTPWECLNSATQGFQNTDLIMFAGRSKVGKTWSEVLLSVYHWSMGYLPLIFSREMSVEQMVRRCDAVNATLPYKRFKAGLLTSHEYERWERALHDMRGSTPFWITGEDDGRLTVSGVRAKIEKYQPSIVYIDGAYLIEDERNGKSHWEKFSNVCQDLHRLTLSLNRPIVVTHQFNLAGSGDKGTDDTLKFGDVKMWFDMMIGLYQTEDLQNNKEMLMRLLKNREGEEIDWVTTWDLDKMEFSVKDPGGVAAGGPSIDHDENISY